MKMHSPGHPLAATRLLSGGAGLLAWAARSRSLFGIVASGTRVGWAVVVSRLTTAVGLAGLLLVLGLRPVVGLGVVARSAPAVIGLL